MTLTQRQLQETHVLEALLSGLYSNREAAEVLQLSVRQIQRKKKAYLVEREASVIHKNTGRHPANRISESIRSQIVHLLQGPLQGYNFTHATEILKADYQIKISVSSVRRIAREHQLLSPRKHRKTRCYPSRERRSFEGELAQADASSFDWLNTGEMLHLHGAIDDATGKILALYLAPQESFEGYRPCLLFMNRKGHLPLHLYTDKRTIFWSTKKEAMPSHEELLLGIRVHETDFVRGLRQMGIHTIFAHSPQAKGRIERLWRTLQDRLPKDFKRQGICRMAEANAYLEQYIENFNRQFSVAAKEETKKYLPRLPKTKVQRALSHRYWRTLHHGCEFSFQNQRYVLDEEDMKRVPDTTKQVELAVYDDIGLRVLIPKTELCVKAHPIQPKKSIPKPKHSEEELRRIRQENGRKGKAHSPWRFY